LEEINIEPTMTRGALNLFKRSIEIALGEKFDSKPKDFRKIPNFMERELNRNENMGFSND